MEKEKNVVLNREVKNISRNVGELQKRLQNKDENEKIDQTTIINLIKLIGYGIDDVKEMYGIEEEQDRLEREIVAAMEKRIKRMEQMIKNDDGVKKMPEMMNLIKKEIKEWWKKVGFLTVQEIMILGDGTIKATLGFETKRYTMRYSKEPLKEKKEELERKERLLKEGYEFIEEGLFKGQLYDTTNNRKKIRQEVKERFKNALVEGFEMKTYPEKDQDMLFSVVVLINVDDL